MKAKSDRKHEIRVAVIAGVFGTLGALIGTGTTIFFTGFVESQKLDVTQKKHSVDAFVESAWEDPDNKQKSMADYFKLINKLSVYAPKSLVTALGNYQASGCAAKADDSSDCRILWAKVVHEIRKLSGSDKLEDEDVIKLIWGE